MLTFAALLLAFQGGSEPDVRLLYFTSSQCLYCVQMAPLIDQLEREGHPVQRVDTDLNPQWSSYYGITALPAYITVVDDRVVDRAEGKTTLASLVGMLRRASAVASQNRANASSASSERRSSTAQSQQGIGNGNTSAGRSSSGMAYDVVHSNGASGDEYKPSAADQLPNDRLSAAYDRALRSTVRILVEDAQGIGTGTGTLIHQANDEALVLTCGHLFRDCGTNCRISVDVGFPDQTYRVEGRLLSYRADLNDTALLVIKPRGPIEISQVALPTYQPVAGDVVFSVGSNGGDDPTIEQTRVKAISQYGLQEIVTKYDTYGRPAQGRSGGGLFTAGGQLIGVCNAAAELVDEGIYTGMQSIHGQLALVGLAEHFSDLSRLAQNPTPSAEHLLAQMNSFGHHERHQSAANQMATGHEFGNQSLIVGASTPSINATQVGLTNANRNGNVSPAMSSRGDDFEIIVLVRSKTNPGEMESVVIRNPSPELLETLRVAGSTTMPHDSRSFGGSGSGLTQTPVHRSQQYIDVPPRNFASDNNRQQPMAPSQQRGDVQLRTQSPR